MWWRKEISVFGDRSAREKRGGPKMSFAPWFAINHAFARRLDRPTDQRPLSAQAIAFAATANAIVALVVVCRKEGRKEGRSHLRWFVRIGNEARDPFQLLRRRHRRRFTLSFFDQFCGNKNGATVGERKRIAADAS